MNNSFELTVSAIIEETARARTILFAIPEDLQEVFHYQAGQYLTVEQSFEGKPIRRAYSICTSPHETTFGFTVKRVEHGKMSSFLTRALEIGDRLKIFPSGGRFRVEVDPDARWTYYMVGVGSGITPIFSIIKNLLEREPLSTINLLYGNRDQENIIYKEAVIDLAEKYSGQLNLRFLLSQPISKRFLPFWDNQPGRIDREHLNKFMEAFPKQTKSEKFFLCGPGQMIEELTGSLLEMSISEQQIFVERFNNDQIVMESKNHQPSKATIHLDGETIQLDIKDQSILQSIIDAGYDPPFSCTSGVCTTCMAKLIKGQVNMDVNYGLDEDEVAEGYILTCQSHPTTDEIELTYDV